ncbi:MAG: hypothetical protein ACTSWY_01515 [Promethearchaeota archaeon]
MKRKTRLYIVIIISVSIFLSFNFSSGIDITTTGDTDKDFNNNLVEISVTEDCQDFLMGYSQLGEKNSVIDWLTSNFDVEIIRFAKARPMVHFKTKIMVGYDVVSAILNQTNFGVRYIQDNPEIYLHDTI